MSVNNGPFTVYTSATRIDDELEHTLVTYGEPYQKLIGAAYYTYRVKTTTTSYSYRLCFMTSAAAAAGITALQAEFDAAGALLTPARNIATVTARLGYNGLAYDIVVNYCNSLAEEEAVP